MENKTGWNYTKEMQINKIQVPMMEEDSSNENKEENNQINEIQDKINRSRRKSRTERQNQVGRRRQDDNLRRSVWRRQAPDELEINPS